MDRIKNIAFVSLAQILNTVVSILCVPYLSRSLSVIDYGTYSQVLLIQGLFVSIFGFGLSTVLIYYFNTTDRKKSFITSLYGALAGGLASGIIMYFGSSLLANSFSNPEIIPLLKIYSLAPLISITSGIFNTVLVCQNKVKNMAFNALLINALRLGVIFIAINIYHSLGLVFVSIMAVDLLGILIAGMMIPKDLFGLITPDFAFLGNQILKGINLSLTGLIGYLMFYTDSLMVSYFKGPESFAIYKNGAFEVPFFASIYGSIAAVILPEITKLINAGELSKVAQLKRIVIENSIIIIYPALIFLLVFNQELISLYLSDKYLLSSGVFLIFNLTLLIRINDYADVLIATGKTAYILKVYIFAFLLNLLLNYLFIETIGIAGAALATVIAILIVAVFQLIASEKLLQERLITFKILKSAFLVISLSLVLSYSIKSAMHLLTQSKWMIVVSGLIYASLILIVFIKTNLLDKRVLNNLILKKK